MWLSTATLCVIIGGFWNSVNAWSAFFCVMTWKLDHCALTTDVADAARTCFMKGKDEPRKDWISGDSWQLIKWDQILRADLCVSRANISGMRVAGVSGTPSSVGSPCSVADTLVCTSPVLLSPASPLSQGGEEVRTASPVSDGPHAGGAPGHFSVGCSLVAEIPPRSGATQT